MDKRFESENPKMEEMKKQSSNNLNNKKSLSSSSSSGLVFDEFNVAEILLQLPYIIEDSESRRPISFNWVVKRKRSALNSTPSPTPSPLHHPPNLVVHDVKPEINTATTSPTSPLSFSPTSDFDDKLKLKLNLSSKTTSATTPPTTEAETVKFTQKRLKAIKPELKAKNCRGVKGNPIMETNKSLNLNMEFALPKFKPSMKIQDTENQKVYNQQPLFINQTVMKTATCVKNEEPCSQIKHHQFSSTINGGDFGMVSKKVNIKCPTGIPDLNVCAEDDCSMEFVHIQQFDFRRALINKARAAEARKKRREIYKGKIKTHK